MDFYTIYKALCVEIGKSATGVALELGVHRSTVSNWKNGGAPRQEILNKIANYFDVSVDYLLGNTDIKKKATPKEQLLTDEQEALLNYCSDLSNDDLEKVIDYIELLKLKNNAEQKERIKLVARSGEQKEIETSQEDIDQIVSSLNEDTTSDH